MKALHSSLKQALHRHPEIRILPPIVGPCGERASHMGHDIRKRIAVRAARAASDAKRRRIIVAVD